MSEPNENRVRFEPTDFEGFNVLPGGMLEPKDLGVKIGPHVEKLLEASGNDPEVLEHLRALLRDVLVDFRKLGSETAAFIEKHIEKSTVGAFRSIDAIEAEALKRKTGANEQRAESDEAEAA